MGKGRSEVRRCKKLRVQDNRGSDTENHSVDVNGKQRTIVLGSSREGVGENYVHSCKRLSNNGGGDRNRAE